MGHIFTIWNRQPGDGTNLITHYPVSCYMLWLWACFYPKLISNKVKQLHLRWSSIVERASWTQLLYRILCSDSQHEFQAVPGTAQPLSVKQLFLRFCETINITSCTLQYLTVKEWDSVNALERFPRSVHMSDYDLFELKVDLFYCPSKVWIKSCLDYWNTLMS